MGEGMEKEVCCGGEGPGGTSHDVNILPYRPRKFVSCGVLGPRNFNALEVPPERKM